MLGTTTPTTLLQARAPHPYHTPMHYTHAHATHTAPTRGAWPIGRVAAAAVRWSALTTRCQPLPSAGAAHAHVLGQAHGDGGRLVPLRHHLLWQLPLPAH
eukprot:scaffold113490_cov42-Phaeocystis_antarctica.AAC.1